MTKLKDYIDEASRPVGPNPFFCPPARELRELAEELLSQLQFDVQLTPPTGLISVNQKRLILADRFMELAGLVEVEHRKEKPRKDHQCLWEVYEEQYRKFMAIYRRLNVPIMVAPASPSKPTKIIIPGITLEHD